MCSAAISLPQQRQRQRQQQRQPQVEEETKDVRNENERELPPGMVIPWNGDVSGPEEAAQREPHRVGQREIVDVLLDVGRAAGDVVHFVDGPPAGFGPAVHGEEHQRHGDEDGAHGDPHVLVQRRHETEDARFLFHGLLDHDADAQLHERGAEVDHSFA